MIQLIPDSWKRIWDKWDIRGVILFSLTLQIFLIFFGAARKRTKGLLRRFVWIAYLLADWAASFCVGLISNNPKSNSTITKKDYLIVFWAPFLLLHLGGPDTITAFALEDNELWLRHLLSLVFQAATAVYVFFLTLPDNPLWLPTAMMFVAGLIKYGERTRALYLASMNGFRQSLVADPGPDYAKVMEELYSRKSAGLPARIVMIPDLAGRSEEAAREVKGQKEKSELEAVHKAYFFFQMFKGLIVDMIYSFGDRRKSQQYFKTKNAEEALGVIEIELNFMYEAFYTKVPVVRHWLGFLCKCISFIAIGSSLGLFLSKDKHGFNRFDVCVTYALLYGALALDTIAFFRLIFTEYTATLVDESQEDLSGASGFQKLKVRLLNWFNGKILAPFLRFKRPRWERIEEGLPRDGLGLHQPSTFFLFRLFRRWFGSISAYNFMKYCLDQSVPKVPHYISNFRYVQLVQLVYFEIVLSVKAAFHRTIKYFGCVDVIDQWQYQDKRPFLKELWEYIFKQLQEKSNHVEDEDPELIQSLISSRGEWVLEQMELDPDQSRESKKRRELVPRLKPFVDSNEVAFDQCLILWHIATSLCYFKDDDGLGGDLSSLSDDEEELRKLRESKDPTELRELGELRERRELRKLREYSMLLSDYMLYLLVVQPTMMSVVAGIGEIRYRATCEEAKKFFSKRKLEEVKGDARQKQACNILLGVPTDVKSTDVKGERSISLLFDACRLAKELNNFEKEKWKIIAPIWLEIMSFAASQCRPTAHVKVLSEGGELISLVWLLMVQLGLGKQFQFKDAKAKLVVGQLPETRIT